MEQIQFDEEIYEEVASSGRFNMEEVNNFLHAVEEAKIRRLKKEMKQFNENFAKQLYEYTKDLEVVSKCSEIPVEELKILLGL